MFHEFRKDHGKRLQLDTRGESSIDLSLRMRLQWAEGKYVEPMNKAIQFWSNVNKLQDWGVLHRGAQVAAAVAGPPPAAVADPPVKSPFLLEKVETLTRIFMGLHTRALRLWQGGIYHLVLLCHPDEAWQGVAVQRAMLLWRRLLAFEEVLANGTGSDNDDRLVQLFASEFLWSHGTVYRELLCKVSEGRVHEARVYAWRVFGSVYHEKGCGSVCLTQYMIIFWPRS